MKMEALRRRTRLSLPSECQSRTDLLRRSLGLGARLMTYFDKLREDGELQQGVAAVLTFVYRCSPQHLFSVCLINSNKNRNFIARQPTLFPLN